MTAFGQQWEASYNPQYQIQLSFDSLPLYAFFSGLRGLIAYILSLIFTLSVGFWAAKSSKAEKIIIPFLDIMQSIPVLGFLPGLVLSLVALFPKTNIGLELSSILMIFTGQVWNMVFAFYSSLKSIPSDLQEASAVMNLTVLQRFKILELPFSAMNLAWNSLMSMAGGWFFLTVCEAFTLGDKDYRLPGLGAYMAVAIEKGEARYIIAGIAAMAAMIIFFDVFLWKPVLALAHRYRLEETEQGVMDEPFIQFFIKNSVVIRWIGSSLRFRISKTTHSYQKVGSLFFKKINFWIHPLRKLKWAFLILSSVIVVYLAGRSIYQLFNLLSQLQLKDWFHITLNTGYTFLRVIGAVLIGTLWTVPVAIWIVQSPNRLRVAQPVIQLLASFPAPMLYPLAIAVFIYLNIHFEVSAMLLMLLGVQWYILFNVLAGALKIPLELKLVMKLMGSSTFEQWRYLFVPSILPSLVTGWVTAAGGAWNASIVSEIVSYQGKNFEAHGLGADISRSAAHGDFASLAACLLVMVFVVIILNRTFWSKLYRLTQTRYRLDL